MRALWNRFGRPAAMLGLIVAILFNASPDVRAEFEGQMVSAFQASTVSSPEIHTETHNVEPTGAGLDLLDFWKWTFTQGALAVVLAIVFWSYRRDYVRIIQKDEQNTSAQIATLTTMVGQCMTAIEASRAQSHETEQSNNRLTRALEELTKELAARGRRG